MLERVRIVLIGTSHPGNIGGVARAMHNMGLADLALVAPRCEVITQESISRASGAEAPACAESPACSPAPDPAVRALRRLTFGYRPEDLTALQALRANFDARLQAWVDNQLNGYSGTWPPPSVALAFSAACAVTCVGAFPAPWQWRKHCCRCRAAPSGCAPIRDVRPR